MIARRRDTTLACGVALLGVVLAAAFVWGVLVPGGTDLADPTAADLHAYYLPMLRYGFAELRPGRMPLWNPYPACGMPLLTNASVGLLYPLYWPTFGFLPADVALDVDAALHLGLALVGMALLCRHFEMSWGASLVAGIVYAYQAACASSSSSRTISCRPRGCHWCCCWSTACSSAPPGVAAARVGVVEEPLAAPVASRTDDAAPGEATIVAYQPDLVSVDGSPATLVRTDGLFRGVPVPAGRHRVEFDYRPRSLVLGGLATLLGDRRGGGADDAKGACQRACPPTPTPVNLPAAWQSSERRTSCGIRARSPARTANA